MTQSPPDPVNPPTPDDSGLDAAQQSLSDALRVSFGFLKFLMVALLIFYVFSGVFIVDEQHTAVRYRFGERIATHGPGWHIGLPFPIDEVVQVPSNVQTVRMDKSFWYHNPEGKSPETLAGQQLDPLQDNFLITGDTNIVHVQFEVKFLIREEDVDDYLRNVGSMERAYKLVRTAARRGMIHAISASKVDDIVIRKVYPSGRIKTGTQAVLDSLDSGITVSQILIDNKKQSMPNAVREAYEGVTQARADKARLIDRARQGYTDALTSAAGGTYEGMLRMVRALDGAQSSDQDALATALRAELDRSIMDLTMPPDELLAQVRAYTTQLTSLPLDANRRSVAMTFLADGAFLTGPMLPAFEQRFAELDRQQREALDKIVVELTQALEQQSADRKPGDAITGDIATRIGQARENRSSISGQAKRAYDRYRRDYETYSLPGRSRALVMSRFEATREKIFNGPVLTQIGEYRRINVTPDPQSLEEQAQFELQRRRDQAQQNQQNR